MTAIQNRYEFVYLFDVANGNPNGDPDAGNLPRLDPDTSKGLVTDVCLKRKVRNYVEMIKAGKPPHAIYMQERAVLNNQHKKAWEALEIEPDKKEGFKKLPKDEAKARELTAWMCKNFFDVRTFGAVMMTEVNCGQVRGPIQIGFAESIDPIVPIEISITRSSVTNEKDIDKERTMGRKHIVPYGLYRAHGFISALLAGDEKKGTGFSEDDLALFRTALGNMFDHDRSAARGQMAARRCIAFKHSSAFGNAPAHHLFEAVTVKRANGSETPARRYADYAVEIDKSKIPGGVEVQEWIS
jgi:CRISPR-associated protein Csd2